VAGKKGEKDSEKKRRERKDLRLGGRSLSGENIGKGKTPAKGDGEGEASERRRRGGKKKSVRAGTKRMTQKGMGSCRK